MTAQQKAASEKAARILELSKGATEGPFNISNPMGSQVWKDGDFFADFDNGILSDKEIRANATWFIETRSLAPDVATALIDAHAEIERLKSAAKEYIDAVEAWGRIGVNRPKHVHNAAAKRRTAALDALKELAG